LAQLPSGTVTFLFTDLEGSTRLWEEHPDAMGAALARHDEIVQDAVAGHRGYVVKTTGDGMHAVFGTAHDAVDAAVAAQLGLGLESWGETGPLRVRMGVHTCEAHYRDGDYYGSEVNRAARLMSVAHGEQIVVSAVTGALVRDGSVELVDLGEHRLRDLTVPEHVFQVQSPGLAADFAPLRSLDAFPGNLPLQVTSFVGRDDELVALGEALEASRLVTVVGVGGVGKTRLALQVAAELVAGFPDGAWVCELAAADDPESLLQVVAAALGVRPRPGSSLEDSIVESLRPRRMLVVLDNCEHLLRAAAGLADRVQRECPQTHVLATSRESLNVAGEQLWPLGPLATPEASDADVMSGDDAVRLFVDRAHSARPGFRLSDANAAAVGEICRRLDGIPLALELAAARVSALSPADISGLLDERFRLLTGGRRSGVERHQTLRATVDWSYSLLDDRERVVFDRLSVCIGSFDAGAAHAIVTGDGVEAWDVLDALTDLVAKSMVVAEEDDATMRYQLLETLRQYGRERLDASGDADTWRRRHAEHYATVAEAAGMGLRGPDELSWKRSLVADLDNVRAAVTWSLERDDAADTKYALRIISALARFISLITAETGEWAERATTRVADAPPEQRAGVFAAAAYVQAFIRGNWEAARTLASDVLNTEDASPLDVFFAYGTLAYCASQTGGPHEALRWATEESRYFEAIRADDFIRVGTRGGRAVWSLMAGDQATARSEADAALRIARRLANPSQLALALWITALTHEADDPDAALAALDEKIELVRAGANDVNFGAALAHIARLRDRNGDLPGALDALHKAVTHFQRVGPRAELVVVVAQLARTLASHGEAEPAATLAGAVASGPLAAMGASRTPQRMERATAAARSQLGDTAYRNAFARGAAMTYDDAIAYARTELDRAIAQTDD
jgi:predicted ATPase/class 3 adenylate cyclase